MTSDWCTDCKNMGVYRNRVTGEKSSPCPSCGREPASASPEEREGPKHPDLMTALEESLEPIKQRQAEEREGTRVRRWTIKGDRKIGQPGDRGVALGTVEPRLWDESVEVVALPDLLAVLREWAERVEGWSAEAETRAKGTAYAVALTALTDRLREAGLDLDPPPDTEETGGAEQ